MEIGIKWRRMKFWLGSLLRKEVGRLFWVVGERMSKFLASARLVLISCTSRENPKIWSQFGPKSQILISHDSL